MDLCFPRIAGASHHSSVTANVTRNAESQSLLMPARVVRSNSSTDSAPAAEKDTTTSHTNTHQEPGRRLAGTPETLVLSSTDHTSPRIRTQPARAGLCDEA